MTSITIDDNTYVRLVAIAVGTNLSMRDLILTLLNFHPSDEEVISNLNQMKENKTNELAQGTSKAH